MRGPRDWEQLLGQRDAYEEWLDDHLMLLDAPAILLGDETNTVHFDWEAAHDEGTLDDRFKVALVDANATGYASCSTAVKIFYQELHEYDDSWVVERCFLPASESNRRMMRADGIPLMTAEGHMPLACFDVICCSQQLIGDEVNIIDMLNFLGIGTTWQERTDRDPLIIRGGASSFNPSLIKDVCDLYFMGEGEDILPALLALVEEGMRAGRSHVEILLEAVRRWDCLWAPRFYEERFSASGELLGMFPLRDDVPSTIRSYHVPDLDSCFIMTKPIGDFQYESYIAGGVEITRGCDGQCSFCVSGFTYLPFRSRSVDVVMHAVDEQLHYSGSATITLSSFCGSSYPHINELMRRIHGETSRMVRMMSQRIDSIHENPHLCNLLARVGSKRIVFGVEGISQRLRQAVSKNYTEQQILDTVSQLVHEGYERIKFMFIAGLPGESRADWEELVGLSSKIRSILDAAESEGLCAPTVLYTWTDLVVMPFTPYQWAKPPVQGALIPPDIEERLGELGIILGESDRDGQRAENLVTQLLLRGDSRLQPLVAAMADAGICHHGIYSDTAEAFVGEWLAEHDVPGYDYWLRECGHDTVFPWDFISFGASKEHLWRRYVETCKDIPQDYPRCLKRCQGCGACTPAQRAQMRAYRDEKRCDNALPLDGLLPEKQSDGRDGKPAASVPRHYAAIEFVTDVRHRVVNRIYWANELGRALNYAGIPYDESSMRVFKPFYGREDWAAGMNVASVALDEGYDDERLIGALNAHLVNMRITGVRWFGRRPMYRSMTYRVPVPAGVGERELAAALAKAAGSDAQHEDNVPACGDGQDDAADEIWNQVYELTLEGNTLLMRVDARLAPYRVFQELFGLSWEEASRYLVERTQVGLADFDQGASV